MYLVHYTHSALPQYQKKKDLIKGKLCLANKEKGGFGCCLFFKVWGKQLRAENGMLSRPLSSHLVAGVYWNAPFLIQFIQRRQVFCPLTRTIASFHTWAVVTQQTGIPSLFYFILFPFKSTPAFLLGATGSNAIKEEADYYLQSLTNK